ncbi:unnamed protein product [Didymodactylos carnosus]|uniref:Uncharacterized protein n=1 Tax=Didymodactylos carnosus TaxID=1234261 RepID=A0A815IRZ2_9BILA|nr:unnamed protein product [Didymodactylos carnosus]CAF1479420.1 unnamed protein product [Didymodactylos carnosus]CAF4260095.1 unnamed protein product [Didymodactylos carnosus]CAF4270106.1 unnamed protein product [Didymodactylos carnosus]
MLIPPRTAIFLLIKRSSSTYYKKFIKVYRYSVVNPYKNLFNMETNKTTSNYCYVFNKDDDKILIQINYEFFNEKKNVVRQFTLLRDMNESVSHTIKRLTNNIDKATSKRSKSKKKSKETAEEETSSTVNIRLLDKNESLIDGNLLNKDVWTKCKKLLINDQCYLIEINAPAIHKFEARYN